MSYRKTMFSLDSEDLSKFQKITTFQGFSMVGALRKMIKMYNKQFEHYLPIEKSKKDEE